MTRALQLAALALALGGAAYFVITAQRAAPSAQSQPASEQAPPSKAAATAASAESVASEAPASEAPVSEVSESEASANDVDGGPRFMGGSKSAIGDDLFLGGSKAAPIFVGPSDGKQQMGMPNPPPGRIQGTLIGEQPGAAAVDTRGAGVGNPNLKARDSKNQKRTQPDDAEPKQTPFMGGSKFDPGSLPLPPRPKTPE